jgi:hypothetical protein
MLKIGDFSKLAQVPVPTLRYYDQVGLLRCWLRGSLWRRCVPAPGTIRPTSPRFSTPSNG